MAVEDGGTDQREVKAREHPMRATMLDLLDGEELRSTELRSRLPGDPSLSTVAYHLAVLTEAELVTCVGGLHRLVA
jgi:DNA-binding transcriptional ArsR family regulator